MVICTSGHEIIANSEIISDDDTDTLSDHYLEYDEQEEMEMDHFNLSEVWIQKIRQIEDNPLSSVREYVDVDLPEEDEDSFGDTFLFAESIKYTPKQTEKLFDIIIKEDFAAKAAQNYVKTYNNDPGRRLPGSYSKPHGRPCSKLTGEHSRLLIDEADFSLQIQRSHDRSYNGKPAKSIVPTGKGTYNFRCHFSSWYHKR
ncbi:hypothetical protein BCV72DRAFT_238815 [Rhizopus microsporus var. microsporus]|uniref:Uncharacterized protein n=1 Tax=Rhizopus microsporus var. microsporus TaxID=86635 RepID=A0A1X0REP5_RHIZD|nr:hypothetical protein BCV72DRAFT_238815 [Rhizopus microsporus var. microsporus]